MHRATTKRKAAMTIPISLPDSLRAFLDEETRECGHESLDKCAASLLEQAQRRKPPHQTFEVEGRMYRLTRLSDGQEIDMHRESIAIDTALPFELAVRRSGPDLAETYAVCRELFGERGRRFDDWKGAFAFPLALEVPCAARRPAYLFTVMNFRSGVEYHLRKLVDPSDKRLKEPLYYPADAAEFPLAEIHRSVAFFVGFLEGFSKSLRVWWKDGFLLTVQSNLILYGFDGEEFFTRDFESHGEFEQTRATLAERLPTPAFYTRDWNRYTC
jgi:hypothetical protein